MKYKDFQIGMMIFGAFYGLAWAGKLQIRNPWIHGILALLMAIVWGLIPEISIRFLEKLHDMKGGL